MLINARCTQRISFVHLAYVNCGRLIRLHFDNFKNSFYFILNPIKFIVLNATIFSVYPLFMANQIVMASECLSFHVYTRSKSDCEQSAYEHMLCVRYTHGCDTIKSVLISYQFEFAIFALFEACECWYSGDKMIMLCPNFVQHQNHSVYQFNKMCLYTVGAPSCNCSAPSCNCR